MSKKVFQKIAVSVAILLSFVICGFLYVCSENGSAYIEGSEGESNRTDLTLSEPTAGDGGQYISNNSNDESSSEAVFVYVCGCVVNPGVYEVPAESRIYEVIQTAGGECREAYLEALNLADHIYDGQKIFVPTKDEYLSGQAGIPEAETERLMVDINRADVNLLMKLPGIGQSRAQAIVEYRKEQGNFTCIEDIMKVSGIKESAFDKIKAYICVR